jgi:hypothetical protein
MADLSVLAPIGRNGIVNSVRKLSGNIVPGWRDVDSSADFIAGMVAALSSGKLVVADASTQHFIGLFNCHKTTSFYRPAVNESVTFTGAASSIALSNAYVKSNATTKVTNSAGTVTYDLTDDYTLNLTNGLIIQTSTGSIGATATVLVTYLYKDINLTGVDQTLGSGKASTIEGNGEIATQVYDTSAAWAENAHVTVSALGLPTIGGSNIIGFVTKVPTASDPELHFQMRLA